MVQCAVCTRARVDKSFEVVPRFDLVSSGKVMMAERSRGWTLSLVVTKRIPANLVLEKLFP